MLSCLKFIVSVSDDDNSSVHNFLLICEQVLIVNK